MADHDTDGLEAAFGSFRGDVFAQVTPPGPQAVRATVRRRRVAVTTGAVLALALVAGPVAGYAALADRHPHEPPNPPAATVERTPTPTPTGTPEPRTDPGARASAGATPSDGQIGQPELLAAKPVLPPWPAGAPASCGVLGDVSGSDPARPHAEIMTISHGDADSDGAIEAITVLECRPGASLIQQAVVFERDERGRIVALDPVARTGDGIGWIVDAQPASPTGVRVEVGDLPPCCDTPDSWPQRQWRTYGWHDQRFTQTGGPTAFPVNPHFTDLSVTAGDMTFEEVPGDDEWRAGTITVTIANKGPTEVKARLELGFGAGKMRHDVDSFRVCKGTSATAWEPNSTVACETPPLAAGAQTTLVLRLLSSRTNPDSGVATASVRSVYVVGYTVYNPADANGDDNSVQFDYR